MAHPEEAIPFDANLPEPAAGADLHDPRLYVNRELSLLAFQRRVLEEARDPANPLLERVRFLAIVSSNLDEFFMVRVAGLRQQVAAGVSEPSPDGLTPAEQLAAVRRIAFELAEEVRACLHGELVPQLEAAGIHLLDYGRLDARQRQRAQAFFERIVFPVLTPLAVDPGRPFPHISNRSLNLAVLIRDPHGQERFARVKVPDTLPRLVPLRRSSGGVRPDGTAPWHHAFVFLEQVIGANIERLFPGMEILATHPFHVTRDAEMLIQEMEAADLLETIEQGVRQRRFGHVVRLKLTTGTPSTVRRVLVENLEMDPRDVYVHDGPLALADLDALYAIDRRDLKFPPFMPAMPQRLAPAPGATEEEREEDIFARIRRHDVLLHHPFDSFTPVVDFLRAAARDPDVLAIKQTLYRVGRNSPVVAALLEAAQHGKQVAVLVELKARFDEESNIGWARALEAEGVHVIYGLLGLKTHSKIALVVRREGSALRRYVHLSTGNYNAVTALAYTDLGLFTCDEAIGDDATHLFNYLTGYSGKRDYRKLLVAPIALRERLEQLVAREVAHQRAGRGGHLVFKINALVDPSMARVLYRAAQEGVRCDLIVRGMCCLRPGLPGVSETVHVTSIVGRFLEHSRVFWFRNGGDDEVYIGSADLMTRNLDRRVEVVFPVHDRDLVRRLRDDVLGTYLADTERGRVMNADGSYSRRRAADGEPGHDSQAALLAGRAFPRR